MEEIKSIIKSLGYEIIKLNEEYLNLIKIVRGENVKDLSEVEDSLLKTIKKMKKAKFSWVDIVKFRHRSPKTVDINEKRSLAKILFNLHEKRVLKKVSVKRIYKDGDRIRFVEYKLA